MLYRTRRPRASDQDDFAGVELNVVREFKIELCRGRISHSYNTSIRGTKSIYMSGDRIFTFDMSGDRICISTGVEIASESCLRR